MSKPSFRVTFFKNLLNGSGHSQECPQATVDVDAQDTTSAISAAQRKFAEYAEVTSWTLRADYFNVQPLPDAPDVAPRPANTGNAAVDAAARQRAVRRGDGVTSVVLPPQTAPASAARKRVATGKRDAPVGALGLGRSG